MNQVLFLATILISLPLLALSQCNPQDKAILLQIKSHFGGAGLLRDWDPKTDCCSDWPFIGCTSDYDPNPDRVNAVTVSGGSGLKGNIPDVLGNLPFLNNIIFFDEPKLTGPIPQSLSKLTMLRVITERGTTFVKEPESENERKIGEFDGEVERFKGFFTLRKMRWFAWNELKWWIDGVCWREEVHSTRGLVCLFSETFRYQRLGEQPGSFPMF